MWDFFKSFSGPIATIIASLAALVVTCYFAWHQKSIAYQQKEIAKEKLRLDLFDKRYKAFETIFPYYDALLDWKGTDEQKEARTRFFMSYQQSRFLFGKEVEIIFKELFDAGIKVIVFKENSQSLIHDQEFFHKSFNETQDILVNMFDDRLNILKVAILPYIDFQELRFSEGGRGST